MSVRIRQHFKMSFNNLRFLAFFTLASCSSIHFVDQKRLADETTDALQSGGRKIEELQSRQEFDQRLFKWLNAHTQSDWQKDFAEAENKMSQFSKLFKGLQGQFDLWRKAAADFQSFSYLNPEIDSRSPEWTTSESLVNELTLKNADFNLALEKTNSVSNDLRHFWVQKGYYKSENPQVFGKEIDRQSLDWREQYSNRVQEFSNAQSRFDQFQVRRTAHFIAIDQILAPLQGMHRALAKMEQLIKRNDQLKIRFNKLFMGILEIASLDSDWAQYLDLKKSYAQDQANYQQSHGDFNELNQKFDSAIQAISETQESAAR